ncbi:ATP-binding protein [Promicromonospora sp. NPDC050880]|uniref:ATP-binding protein n=1 Tax=Promicromonospora sp. NPDC050880 TaxID=3364406 RepID=UPI0037A99673
MTHDPFGTGALRRAVTEAWLASPTRFREDANAEEDHARGYYRDRVVVELAQNAADAAARAGVPGRLVLRLEAVGAAGGPGDGGSGSGFVAGSDGDGTDGGDPGGGGSGWRLVAANTGAPLDAAGVASLVSLRASAKVPLGTSPGGAAQVGAGTVWSGPAQGPPGSGSGDAGRAAGGDAWPDGGSGTGGAMRAVGRFGVGFAAVRSVSDEVLVRSRDGGVRFSLAATRAELALDPDAGEDDAEVGPLSRDRSIDGPISRQRADLASAAGEQESARLLGDARARGDALPVLRLPFPAPGTTAGEPDTVVELVLRDAAAVAAVRDQLAALDDALLLALPALAEVVIEDDFAGQPGSEPHVAPPSAIARVLRDVSSRWRVHRTSGVLDPDGTLPTEERRADWSVLWALPTTAEGARVSTSLHAPTPTDVPLTFPALLIASFPVDPGRRGVLPGPTTDRVAAEAGRAYAAFLGGLAAERDVLGLVPTGLPAGEVDAAVRAAAEAALRATPLLRLPGPGDAPGEDPSRSGHAAPEGTLAHPRVPDEEHVLRVPPQDAAHLAGPLGEDPALARVLSGGSPAALVTVPVRHQALARSLGAHRADLAELVEALPPEPGVVRDALDALAAHTGDPAVLEAVAGLPVPLADGRTSRGARGTVLLDAPHLAQVARDLGVRVVHPDAAHPLLERVGAARTSARGLLADAAVRSAALAAAEEILEDGDADQVGRVLSAPSAEDAAASPSGAAQTVRAVLELVALAVTEDDVPGPGGHGGGRLGAGSVPEPDGLPFWLGELPVVADGDVVPLRESALPGTWAARNLDVAVVDEHVVERWGPGPLAAAGARAGLAPYRVADVLTTEDTADHGPDDPAGWLSAWDEYVEHLADELGPGAWVGDIEAVPDLDVLREAPEGDRGRTGPGDETGVEDPLAAALGRIAADSALRRALLTPVRSPDAPGREAVSYTAWFLRRVLGAPFAIGDTPLLAPAPPATAGLDDAVLVALGGLHNLADLPGRDWATVLDRLPEPVGDERVPAAVARAVWAGLAALARTGDAGSVTPARLPALGPGGVTVEATEDLAVAASPRWAQLGPVVPAPADVAEDLADLLDLPYEDDPAVVPDGAGERVDLDPRVRALVPGAPATWRRHEPLTVEGTHVAWWVSTADDGSGVPHAGSVEGLARALAELTGADALLLEAALRDPDRAELLDAERAWP